MTQQMTELVLLIKKHGPVSVLESFALICEENAKTISETGKRSRNPVWREQSFRQLEQVVGAWLGGRARLRASFGSGRAGQDRAERENRYGTILFVV